MSEISTPMSAYKWLREIGLSHEVSLELTKRKDMFDYYVETLRCLRGF